MDVVARAVAGDRSAWEQIWDAHGPRLHAYAVRLLRNQHDADDVVADTFVTAAEHLAELRDPDALRPWLYAICRRHVQRRWEDRDRMRPVEDDYLTTAVDSRDHVVSTTGIDAAAASSLLWEAADGLSPTDRELLALVLDSHLDSGAVAAVTGEATSAVYVRISRLKDTLGRAAGALLVARHHRQDCAELDAVLAPWDGVYSTLWRKRIARHVEACDTCGDSHKVAAGSLFSIAAVAPLALMPALKDRVLNRSDDMRLVAFSSAAVPVAGRGSSVDFVDGWPRARSWDERRRRGGALALIGGALVAVIAIGGAIVSASTPPALTPVGAATSTAPDVASATASTGAAGTEAVGTQVPNTTAKAAGAPETGELPLTGPSLAKDPLDPAATSTIGAPTAGPTSAGPIVPLPTVRPTLLPTVLPTSGPTVVVPVPPTSSAPAPPTVAPDPTVAVPPATVAPPRPSTPAPTVDLALRSSRISTACGSPSTTGAVASVTGDGARTTIQWGGTAPGSQSFVGSGSATIGPYSSVSSSSGTDTVTVTATVTDALGRTASTSRSLSVVLAPC